MIDKTIFIMNPKQLTLTLGVILCCAFTFSQDNDKTSKSKKDVNPSRIDSIIDGKLYKSQSIEAAKDSTKTLVLEDHHEASDFDKKWLDELYSNSLFDVMYESVTHMSYDAVEYPELPTAVLKERLKAMNSKTPFNIEYNEALESVIKSYLKNRRQSLQRLMTLSDYYFPMFEKELDNYNIPLEIKYLAIVESALKPRAKSRVGASGLWQFMYPTGKMYGLDVTSYVDDRFDPLKSTEAACKYLSKLYDIFDDWDLALAAYNSGPGNVNKAIRRSGGYKNYWNIRPNLPRETAGYVPAFLATMYVFEYAEEHGFKKSKPGFRYFETDTIHVKQTIGLDQVAQLLELNIEELQFLNPAYKLDIIPYVEGKDYTLRLPRHSIGKFVSNEADIYAFVEEQNNKREKPLPQMQVLAQETRSTYKVKRGDNLGTIAKKNKVTVAQIKKWNNLKSNNIQIGQTLKMFNKETVVKEPVVSTKVASVQTESKAAITEEINNEVKTYKVKPGDTLWSISKKFPGLTVDNIKKWNDISGNDIKAGTTIKISG